MPGKITVTVRLAPGTLNLKTTLVSVFLDTDQDPSTGSSGTDYIVELDAEGERAIVLQYKYPGTDRPFGTVGTLPAKFVDDSIDVTVPLTLLGNDDGRTDFRVYSFAVLSSTTSTTNLDEMPDFGLPPGHVQ